MKTRTLRAIATACLTTFAATGCYSYEPIRIEQVAPGAIARARVDQDEARRISEVIGRDDRLLEGEVLQADNSRLLLAVPMTAASPGLATRTFHQRVEVPRASILEVEVRRFDALKTALVIGGAALAAGAAITAAFIATDNPEGDEKRQPDAIVVPIVRF